MPQHRHRESEHDTRDRGVDPGGVEQRPRRDGEGHQQQSGRAVDPKEPAIPLRQEAERQDREDEERQRHTSDLLGVEDGDDADGEKVIHHRQGQQEQAQGAGEVRPDDGEHGDGERDVGGGGDRPTAQGLRMAPVDRRVDQRRARGLPRRRRRPARSPCSAVAVRRQRTRVSAPARPGRRRWPGARRRPIGRGSTRGARAAVSDGEIAQGEVSVGCRRVGPHSATSAAPTRRAPPTVSLRRIAATRSTSAKPPRVRIRRGGGLGRVRRGSVHGTPQDGSAERLPTRLPGSPATESNPLARRRPRPSRSPGRGRCPPRTASGQSRRSTRTRRSRRCRGRCSGSSVPGTPAPRE